MNKLGSPTNPTTIENDLSDSETENNQIISESGSELFIDERSDTFLNESQQSESELRIEGSPTSEIAAVTEIKTELLDEQLSFHSEEAARHGSLPPRYGYEGKYSFKLSLSYSAVGKKSSERATFSRLQSKLYIMKDCPFRILCLANKVPSGCFLRATLYYLQPEDASKPVLRCPRHVCEDVEKGNPAMDHVLQSFHENAVYEKDERSGRLSVVVPYPEPEELNNKPIAAFQYKLTCFNSCNGINRRPLAIYYTLEKNKREVGRQMIEVKICSCPARDLRQEEKRHMSGMNRIYSDCESIESSEKYFIETEDQKLYNFLLCMKELYKSNDFVNCQKNIENCLKD